MAGITTVGLPADNRAATLQHSLARGLWSLFHPEETWLAFALLAVLFVTTVKVVEDARWVREMPALTGMALGALLTGYVLARLRVPAILLHPVGVVIGMLAILWQIVNAASGTGLGDKIVDAAVRLYTFIQVARTGNISTDGLPFVVQVLVLTWFVGYLSSWFLYRSHNAWLATVPSGVALMVNLSYLPGKFVFRFIFFVVASLLLVMLTYGVEQQRRWRQARVPGEELTHLSYVGPVLVFGSILLLVSFWMPLLQQSTPVTFFWERITGPWRGVEQEFDRLFAAVSSGKTTPLHSFNGALPFRGSVSFGDPLPLAGRLGVTRDIVMYVEADEPGYWRAESYDTYTSQGWIATTRVPMSFPEEPTPQAFSEYKGRKPFTQYVEVAIPMNVLVARGMHVYGNTTANADTFQPATYTLQLLDLSRNRQLSPELQGLAARVRSGLQQSGLLVSRGEMQRLMPPDLRVESTTLRGNQIESVLVSRTLPFPPDYARVKSANTLVRGQKYTISSSVAAASAKELQETSEGYPGWVRDQYLQLPSSLPSRIRALALEWTLGATTPYDKAAAIETRLREFPYTTNIPPPPRGSDGVDHFLFNLQTGYADYHASAMAVLLRTLGIPTRVSVGYVAGDWDTEQQRYTVREIHAHAWPEVFFPGYGWTEFNPTPNYPAVSRSSDSESSGGLDTDEDLGDLDAIMLDDELNPENSGAASSGGGELLLGLERVGRVGLAVLAILGVLWLLLRFLWLYGLSRLNFAGQTYEKMCRLAYLARLGPRPRQTPTEYAQTLAMALPIARGNIQEISQGYVRSVYGQKEFSPQEVQRLKAAWNDLRWKLIPRVLRWREKRGPAGA